MFRTVVILALLPVMFIQGSMLHTFLMDEALLGLIGMGPYAHVCHPSPKSVASTENARCHTSDQNFQAVDEGSLPDPVKTPIHPPDSSSPHIAAPAAVLTLLPPVSLDLLSSRIAVPLPLPIASLRQLPLLI